jgi:hypothetical protein
MRQSAAGRDFGSEASRVKRCQPIDNGHLFAAIEKNKKIFVGPLEAKNIAS